MIPQFPEFKCLTWIDKEDVERHTERFPPYSDFNFSSLYAWNVDGQVKISSLNDNLIVLFSDYVTGKPFLSFYGSNDIVETALALIEYSLKNLDEPVLKLVPQLVANFLCHKVFTISEDRDSFDYVYLISEFEEMHRWPAKYRPAQQLRGFVNKYQSYSYECWPLTQIKTDELNDLYAQWALQRNIDHFSTNEYCAFERLLNIRSENTYVATISHGSSLIGFVILETLANGYSIIHFNKANTDYKGVYETLLWRTAQYLSALGLQYINFEQDMGIEALRRSKEKYKRHSFLRKFTVQKMTVPP